MGLFDFVKDAGKWLEDDILEPIGKDIVPAAAAWATGGASLKYLPPSKSGILSDITGELLGVDAKTLTQGVMSGGANSPKPQKKPQQQVQQSQFTQPPQATVTQQQVQQMQQVQQPKNTSDLANSPQVGNNAPQVISQGFDSNTMVMIGGGLVALLAVVMMNKK